MRIVHAVATDAFAGVERHVAVLAAAQARTGQHHVVVLGGDPTLMRRELLGSGVETRPSKSVGQLARLLTTWRGADIVHAHMTAAETAAAMVKPWTGAAMVVTRHFGRHRGSSLGGQAVSPLIGRLTDAQIAISHYVAERIEGASEVVYPGVYRPSGVLAASARERVILMVQRLEPEKRTDEGIAAFAEADLDGWELRIAGDGVERSRLESVASRLGVGDRVRFLGHHRQPRDLMTRAALMIAPCDVEGLGLSALEAMAHGVPVVASKSGGHLETVGRATPCLLYPPGDWQSAGQVLRDVAQDLHARDRAAAAGRRVQSELFSVSRQVAATHRIYETALK